MCSEDVLPRFSQAAFAAGVNMRGECGLERVPLTCMRSGSSSVVCLMCLIGRHLLAASGDTPAAGYMRCPGAHIHACV